jgi:hypothetical protein
MPGSVIGLMKLGGEKEIRKNKTKNGTRIRNKD